ncbi:MAG: serine/threonine-protein kinase, partial [Thermoplasmatota archaeon]
LVAAGLAWSYRGATRGPTTDADWRRLAIYRAHLDLGTSQEEVDEIARRLGITREEAERSRALAAMDRRVATRAPSATLVPGMLYRGRYRIERLLGSGTFGNAFLATDPLTSERVVLKELRAEWRSDAEASERFAAEVALATRLSNPHLVRFRSIEPEGDGYVLVLDYVEGQTLRERLTAGTLDSGETARLASELLEALHALHKEGIVHRDVKPDNVVLGPTTGAVLLDFGTAASHRSGTRLAGAAHPGTPGYMSPEQRRGIELDARSDLYSLALTLWEALTGSTYPMGLPPLEWRDVLDRALEENPTRRFPDALAMRDALPDAGRRAARRRVRSSSQPP